MKRATAQVLKGAQELPEEERLQLIEKLLQAWAPPDEFPGDDEALMKEIDRRTAEIDAGTAKLHSWDEVKKRARAAVRARR